MEKPVTMFSSTRMSLFIITISYNVLTRVQQLSCDGGLALTIIKQKCEKKTIKNLNEI